MTYPRNLCYGDRMATDEHSDRVVRVSATDDEWRRLKILAVERDLEIRELVTKALHTAPLTKKAFT